MPIILLVRIESMYMAMKMMTPRTNGVIKIEMPAFDMPAARYRRISDPKKKELARSGAVGTNENAKQAYLPYRDNCTQVFGEELGAEVFDAGEKLLTGLDDINETTDSIVGWGNSLKEGFISTKDTCKEMFLRLK